MTTVKDLTAQAGDPGLDRGSLPDFNITPERPAPAAGNEAVTSQVSRLQQPNLGL